MPTESNGVPCVHFRLYVMDYYNDVAPTENWTLEHMESIARDIAAYAGRFGRLLGRIYAEQRLKN